MYPNYVDINIYRLLVSKIIDPTVELKANIFNKKFIYRDTKVSKRTEWNSVLKNINIEYSTVKLFYNKFLFSQSQIFIQPL